MRFAQCIQRLYCEPWLILPAMHRTMAEILQAHIDRVGADALPFDMEDDEADAVTIDNGVGVLPIRGVISRDVSKMERMSGAVDVNELDHAFDALDKDSAVSAIVLSIDSPGGSVTGVPELAARIAKASKPVIAHSGGLMASAAYWIASGAKAIYASPSATVGSIGVYLPLLDSSRAYEMAGLKVDVIKAGGAPLKAAGLPGTTLTEAQRENLQASVDYIHGQFTGFIKSRRRHVPDDSMRGQTFFGSQAVSAGLVDSVAGLDRAIEDARTMAGKRF